MTTYKPFATERGARSFATKECTAIRVEFDTLQLPDNNWVGVARLRGDQQWMTPDLQSRGLVTVKYNSNIGIIQKQLRGGLYGQTANKTKN